MRLFSGMIGDAKQEDKDQVKKELENILLDQEQVENAFRIIKSLIVFTDSRLILVKKLVVSDENVSYKSIPYRSITSFMVETSGRFGPGTELKIWISSGEAPAEILRFNSDESVMVIQKALAAAVLSK